MKKITVYTTNPCPYCSRAKQLLSGKGLEFEEIQLPWDEQDKWDELMQRSGMRTMPQIFVGDQLVGGFTELNAANQSGELDKLLNS